VRHNKNGRIDHDHKHDKGRAAARREDERRPDVGGELPARRRLTDLELGRRDGADARAAGGIEQGDNILASDHGNRSSACAPVLVSADETGPMTQG
jgi:hypothetical protein